MDSRDLMGEKYILEKSREKNVTYTNKTEFYNQKLFDL